MDLRKKIWWKYKQSDIITYNIGNGFYIEESSNGEFCLVDNCSDSGDYGYESNWLAGIKYIHEFQHILKFCKIEKEIKLL